MVGTVASAENRCSLRVDITSAVCVLPGRPVLRAPDGELVVTVTACVLVADMSALEELSPLMCEQTSHATFAGGVSDCGGEFWR